MSDIKKQVLKTLATALKFKDLRGEKGMIEIQQALTEAYEMGADSKITTKQAVNKLVNALKSDTEYYETWKANISMCLYDEIEATCKLLNEPVSELTRQVCNQGAVRFLNILCVHTVLKNETK
jgi:hypothetical protein